ncbi:MAG: hypothetical protein JXR34_10845 [Bacteroidales bacterium]|nr:hypothetical protein [Bacteroidales bacterium]
MNNQTKKKLNNSTDGIEYIFQETSWIVMLSVFFLVLTIDSIILGKLTIENEVFLMIIIPTLFFILPALITRIVAFNKTTIHLLNNEIHVSRSSIVRAPIKPSFQLHFSQIKSYVFQEDNNWYWLKLVDTNGKVYRIWKLAYYRNSNFKEFKNYFEQEIKRYNRKILMLSKNEKIDLPIIQTSSNIYQTNFGIFLIIFSLLTLSGFLYYSLYIDINNENMYFIIVVLIFYLAFLFYKVISERKKKD